MRISGKLSMFLSVYEPLSFVKLINNTLGEYILSFASLVSKIANFMEGIMWVQGPWWIQIRNLI